MAVGATWITYFAALYLNFCDFSRYAKNKDAVKVGNMWGLPVNLIYSPVSRQQIGSIGNIRANVVGDPLIPAAQRDPAQYLNPATVQVVPTEIGNPYGNVGRNSLQAPAFFGTDLGLHKQFPIIGERVKLEFRAEFFNVFNRSNFLAPDGNRSNATFGQITSTFPRCSSLRIATRSTLKSWTRKTPAQT